MFRDRYDAGVRLSWALARYKDHDDVLVLAIPRGGVPVAGVIAHELGLKIDVMLMKRIPHPDDAKRSIGAVSLSSVDIDREAAVDVPSDYIAVTVEAVRHELSASYRLYRGAAHPKPVAGRTVILVDDIASTGKTMGAAIARLRAEGARRVVAAVPVGTESALENLIIQADQLEWLCLAPGKREIESWYRKLKDVSEEEAIEVLQRESLTVK